MATRKKKEQKPNDEYDLVKVKLKPSTKRLLALDPGKRNTGIALVACNPQGKVKVVANSIVTNPVNDLTQFGLQRDVFLKEINKWITLYKPDGIIAERFQTRGGQSMGTTIECISAMLGLLGARYDVPIKLITASQWKNAWHRRFNPLLLDDRYKECLTTPHQLDACFIGCYGLEVGLGKELDYDPQTVITQAENSSRVRLINRRRKS